MNWYFKNGDFGGDHCYMNIHTVYKSRNQKSIDSTNKIDENNPNREIAAHYKEKVFPDGKIVHATIKDINQCISCNPIKLKNLIYMKRALVFLMGVLSTTFLMKN